MFWVKNKRNSNLGRESKQNNFDYESFLVNKFKEWCLSKQ